MQPKAARNISIEALRLVAVAGIAVFHTFQWTFQAVCAGVVEYTPLAAFPYSGVLGFINLLGCWANEVFFMISGYFLIASAARAWNDGATWASQMQRTVQRLGKVIFPTAFYCLAALAWSTAISPIPDVTLDTHYWYTLGLEFIWIYAATVCMAPLFGLAKSRLSKRSFTAAVIIIGILAFVVNGYLAAMSSTNGGEFSWLQKIMSAATYVVAFLAGGLLRGITDSMDLDSARTLGKQTLIAVLAIVIILEGAFSLTGNLTAMATLSYKSTSLTSFALAAAFLSLCGNPTQRFEQTASRTRHRHLIGGHARILCDAIAHQQPLAPHLQRNACKHTGHPKQPCVHMHCHRNGHQHRLCPNASRS